ncbi:MAG: hypothetical protein HZA61_08785 [Candidatus Eisenbacteria bacterium]|uniref:T9SS type A sorting domain-containing protein n=1 Tax=Eiseniibacteriota bacterium TaxID=2212470 RepID=A0A933SGM6_UNCEI|nr:hypothetical protein [Candidatus Eisenbacteria bacterium]
MPETSRSPLTAVRRHASGAACLAFLATLISPALARAAAPLDSVFTTDGSVSAVATTGTRTFIGGTFSRVGPVTGNVLTFLPGNIDPAPGYRMVSAPSLNVSLVYASIPDGAGGWFVGGHFSQWQGQTRQGLVHVLADGSLSPLAPVFTGPSTLSGVRALALVGTRLYVGGDFTTVNGQPCRPLLAFENESSDPIAWDSGITSPVYALASAGDTLYAGGTFRLVAGQQRPALAAFDGPTGALLPIEYAGPDPGANITAIGAGDGTLRVSGTLAYLGAPTGGAAFVDTTTGAALAPHFDVKGAVLSVVPDGAGGWFVGGAFSSLHGIPRANLAHVGADGMPTSWAPSPNDTVHALVRSGDTLYVGGDFTLASAASRSHFAAYLASTGDLLTGTPSANARVKSMLVSGPNLIVGGPFSSFAGMPAEGLAAIDRDTWAHAAKQPPGCGRSVNALLAAHGRVYVGGGFAAVTTPASGLGLSDSLGTLAEPLPLFDGNVQAMESDGAGGWFVGGSFASVDGVAKRSLVHLLPGGQLDTAWDASLLPTASVFSLARSGSRLYVAGSALRTVNALSVPLVALDAATGALVPWSGTITPDAGLTSVCANADTVWFAGYFSTVNGQPRTALGSVLASNGQLTSWAPVVTMSASSPAVLAVQYANGVVYAGGAFSTVGGLNRSSFAAIGAVTGTPTTLVANVTYTGPGIVRALEVGPTHVFLGGSFTAVNGSPRANLAGFSLASGALLTWNVAPDAQVHALSLWGNKLYACGDFTTIASTSRARAAALNAITGALDAWTVSPAPYVRAIERSGASVAFGGTFVAAASVVRGGVCALDPATFAVLPFTANANGEVRALAATDDKLYVGGQFTSIGATTRLRFAELTTGGTLTSWSLSPPMTVHAIAVHGSRLYLGGEKQQAGYVGAWQRSTHALQSWSCTPLGVVRLVEAGDRLLVAGACTGIGGSTRTNVCAVQAATGTPLSWAPRFDAPPKQWLLHGGRWYAGGTFTAVNDTMRYGMAAFAPGSGALLPWWPGFNGAVHAFTFAHDTLLAGGAFTSVNGTQHRFFGMLDESAGAALGGEHPANGAIESLCFSGGRVLATGSFSSFPMVERTALAALDSDGRVLPWKPSLTGSVFALAVHGANVHAAGNFWVLEPPFRDFAAAFDTATAAVAPWAPQPDGTVYTLKIADGLAWLGGAFSHVGPLARNNLAQTDLSSGAGTAWNPNANNAVFAIAKEGGVVYVGGNFTNVGGQARNRIAAIDATTGAPSAWNPNASNTVYTVLATNGAVYAGGDFATIGGATRRRLAALSPATGLATAWNPDPDGTVNVLDLRNGLMFVGGLFGTFGNGAYPRTRLAVLDAASGLPSPFIADASQNVYGFAHANGTLYVAGAFTTIAGQSRTGVAGFVDPSWNLELLDSPRSEHAGLALLQAAPQPLRGRGVLRFTLPAPGRVKLALYDLAGREAASLLDSDALPAGMHEVALDARRMPSGVYWARLQWNGETRAQRVVTLR